LYASRSGNGEWEGATSNLWFVGPLTDTPHLPPGRLIGILALTAYRLVIVALLPP
jgi:hypothetical protein